MKTIDWPSGAITNANSHQNQALPIVQLSAKSQIKKKESILFAVIYLNRPKEKGLIFHIFLKPDVVH